jgi:hypothetical protein
MMWRPCIRSRGLVISTAILMLFSGHLMAQQSDTAKNKPIFVTSGQEITPTAAPGSTLLYLNPQLTDFSQVYCERRDQLRYQPRR